MILYKNRNQKIYEKIRIISKGKTNYLRNLSQKKNDGLNRLREQKIGLAIEEIFKINTLKRDYSHYPFNSSRTENRITPIKIRFSNLIDYPIKVKKDKDYSNRKSNIKFMNVPNIKYKNSYEFPKSILPIRYTNNLNNNTNKLANAGKEIINKNI